MNRYFIRLSYDGTDYHGWQIQDNAVSVQGELLENLNKILGNSIELVGCGRTDSGVHAKNFVAHLDCDKDLDTDLIKYKLNGMLSDAIVVHEIYLVDNDLHARFSAKSRAYRYYISKAKNPFNSAYAYYVNKPVNVDIMNKACEKLIGEQDFSSFSRSRTQVKTFICDVKEAYWIEEGDDLVFYIKANRFLRNMVRAIVGTTLDIGLGRKELSHMQEVIDAKDRRKAGTSAPGHGLFLEEIVY